MNELQSGTPSSQLVPQSFRNSTQTGRVQNSENTSIQQPTKSITILNSGSGISLKVDDGNSSLRVLGVSNASGSQSQQTVVVTDNPNYSGVALLILVVSAAMFIYFLKKFNSLRQPTEQPQS